MNHSFRERLSQIPATIGRALMGLVREMAPVVLFFFIVFGLIGLLYKLFVSQYSIEFSAFAKAAIAALIVGKVVLLLDWAGTGHRLERVYPRAVVILFKTIIYALIVITVGMGERTRRAVHEAGGFDAGINLMIANANVDRFLGFVLLISLIVALYLMVQEISRAMGKGALIKLFFDPPANKTEPS